MIFITGGASGLGEETVRRLSSLGAKICIADLQEDRMTEVVNSLKRGKDVTWIKCDVTSEEQCKAAVEHCVKAFGVVHAVINCAGIATVSPMITKTGSISTELFRKTIEINVFGSLYISKYAAVQISKQEKLNETGERGVIIHISSVAAQEG